MGSIPITRSNAAMSSLPAVDVLVAGGGLAGIVTALEALRAGMSVAVVDRDGGFDLWVLVDGVACSTARVRPAG